jgi:hypothetical protein
MAGLLLLLGCHACGTDAVGVNECRQIEEARCVAAAKCGTIEDVEVCKEFYNDHCLHGLAIEDVPRAKVVNACVATIAAAGSCAAKRGAKTAPAECDNTKLDNTEARRVCDLVEEPELAQQCVFLVPDPEDEDEDEDEDKDEDERDADAGQSKPSDSGKKASDAG